MIKLWSEITSGSSTVGYGPYFFHKNHFYSKWVVKFQAKGS